MKIWKRFLALGLVTIITAMMFVGCGSSDISEGVVKNGAIVPVKALHGAGQKLCVYAQPHQGKHQRLPAAGAKQFGKQRKAEKACARRQHAQR